MPGWRHRSCSWPVERCTLGSEPSLYSRNHLLREDRWRQKKKLNARTTRELDARFGASERFLLDAAQDVPVGTLFSGIRRINESATRYVADKEAELQIE